MSDYAVDSCGASCTTCPPPPPNATAACNGTTCGFTCNPGYHACNGVCVSDSSINSCGASCSPCSGIANGSATCKGGACGLQCDAGYSLCGGTCKPNTAVTSCGAACQVCPTPANASATCDGVLCGAACLPGFWNCDGNLANGCESNQTCPVPTAGLVAHYTFTGGAQDSSGSGAHGTVSGATLTTDRKGTPNAAYAFVGSLGQYISFPSNPKLPIGAQPRTVSLWYRGNTAAGYQALFNYGTNSSGARFGLSTYASGKLFFTGQFADVSTTATVSDGLWHHLAVTYNGVTVIVYVDGVEVGRGAKTLNTAGTSLFISKKVGVSGEYVTGELDDLRVYDQALAPSDIDALAKE